MMKGKKNFNDGGEGLLWAMFSHDNGACDDWIFWLTIASTDLEAHVLTFYVTSNFSPKILKVT
jgi:hypothetical protein